MTAATLSHLPFPSDDPTQFVHIISNLLSESECAKVIESHQNLVPSNLTLGTIRTREEFDDQNFADLLWSRISEFYDNDRIQDEDGVWWKAKGLNPHFRISKYEKQGRFTAHYDYSRQTSLNEKTFMSVNIYLNTVPEENKGATRVLKREPGMGNYWNGKDDLQAIAKIQPVMGSASIFRETVWHDGDELLDGVKYLLRTDVVYQREEEFDFYELYGDLPDEEQADRALQLAYALENGGAFEEAEKWHDKANFLAPARFSWRWQSVAPSI